MSLITTAHAEAILSTADTVRVLQADLETVKASLDSVLARLTLLDAAMPAAAAKRPTAKRPAAGAADNKAPANAMLFTKMMFKENWSLDGGDDTVRTVYANEVASAVAAGAGAKQDAGSAEQWGAIGQWCWTNCGDAFQATFRAAHKTYSASLSSQSAEPLLESDPVAQ